MRGGKKTEPCGGRVVFDVVGGGSAVDFSFPFFALIT